MIAEATNTQTAEARKARNRQHLAAILSTPEAQGAILNLFAAGKLLATAGLPRESQSVLELTICLLCRWRTLHQEGKEDTKDLPAQKWIERLRHAEVLDRQTMRAGVKVLASQSPTPEHIDQLRQLAHAIRAGMRFDVAVDVREPRDIPEAQRVYSGRTPAWVRAIHNEASEA